MKDRVLLQAAYNARAFMIGVLGSCTCAYPKLAYPDSTGHAIECPAHYMLTERAGATADELAVLGKLVDAGRVARNGGGS